MFRGQVIIMDKKSSNPLHCRKSFTATAYSVIIRKPISKQGGQPRNLPFIKLTARLANWKLNILSTIDICPCFVDNIIKWAKTTYSLTRT